MTISEWLKWGYTHHKIVHKQDFVHSTEYDKKAEHLKSYREYNKQMEEENNLFHMWFSLNTFPNFGELLQILHIWFQA